MIFSKSKVYEVALSTIKQNRLGNFLGEYIPAILPIMAEYGGVFLFNSVIQSSVNNRFPAKSFAVLEWPSIESFVTIGKDKRAVPLLEQRNQYLDFMIEGCFYRAQEDTEFNIPENRTINMMLLDEEVKDGPFVILNWINHPMNSSLSTYLCFSRQSSEQLRRLNYIDQFVIQIR
jgi:uncharacterized protein (DUF1330 family)